MSLEPDCSESTGNPEGITTAPCGVFPVESGGPVIGLGLLFLVIAIVPTLLGINTVVSPISILFGGFGVFLIWLGITK